MTKPKKGASITLQTFMSYWKDAVIGHMTERNADEEEADDDSWCQYDTSEDELY